VSNPDGATLPASFKVNYDCGGIYTGQVSVASGSPATVSAIPTGSSCKITDRKSNPINSSHDHTANDNPSDTVVITAHTISYTYTVPTSIYTLSLHDALPISVSNPDGATLPASFKVNYDCGGIYTGQVSVASGSPATVSAIPTGSSCKI